MNKYRKKPVVIEAIQFKGNNERDIRVWSNNVVGISPFLEPTERNPTGICLQIATLEGVMTASIGDWIIRGVAGEFYPCKTDIFAQTYEEIEEDE